MRASLVVIPTYNEAESIGQILHGLKSLDVDVLVIDDGSPDGTADIVRMHKSKSLNVKVNKVWAVPIAQDFQSEFSADTPTLLKWMQMGLTKCKTFRK